MKPMRAMVGLCLAVSLLMSNHIIADEFDIEEQRELQLDGASISSVRIDAGAGFLKIKGVQGLAQIKVIAELKVNQDNFTLSLEKQGSTAELIADANPNNESNWWGDSPLINLTVELPMEMALKVDDGSGELNIANINGDIEIDDGSGAIILSEITGTLDVKDGSGNFSLSNLTGPLTLDDGSGSINIQNVVGDVQIDDGSGAIFIEQVSGKVFVEDGSGAMTISNVKGHVTLDDGSGGILLSHLADGVTILNEGSGGLTMNDVSGKVEKR